VSQAEISKEFEFEAAHWLPGVPDGHQCGRMHGHTYRVTVHLRGTVDETTGWIADFADISRATRPLLAELDHHCLNEVAGLKNPTSENLARWFAQRLRGTLPGLSAIRVAETRTTSCLYRLDPTD
jgi:6-pyruvoyltetrahydropterin/6-carboxytetrahydropterin synthase